MADDIGQLRHHVAAGGRADARPVLAEPGMLGGDGDVAEIGQVVAAADALAVDPGDHRLGAIDDHLGGVIVLLLGAALGLPVNVAAR